MAELAQIFRLPQENVVAQLKKIVEVNGKIISFAKFKKDYADAHCYGYGARKLYAIYLGHPRINMFAFYPPQTTKADSLKIAYEYMLETLEDKHFSEWNDENVMWGNCGVPLQYGSVRARIEVKDNEVVLI